MSTTNKEKMLINNHHIYYIIKVTRHPPSDDGGRGTGILKRGSILLCPCVSLVTDTWGLGAISIWTLMMCNKYSFNLPFYLDWAVVGRLLFALGTP